MGISDPDLDGRQALSGQSDARTSLVDQEDTYVRILKQMKGIKAESTDNMEQGEADGEAEGERITFDDYEKLMQRLEKEKNFEEIKR